MVRTVLLAAAAAIVIGGSAQAHHSYSLYLEDQTVSIEGELAQFVYRSPHTIVRLKTADSATYNAEWWDRHQLASAESPAIRCGSAIASWSRAIRAETGTTASCTSRVCAGSPTDGAGRPAERGMAGRRFVSDCSRASEPMRRGAHVVSANDGQLLRSAPYFRSPISSSPPPTMRTCSALAASTSRGRRRSSPS